MEDIQIRPDVAEHLGYYVYLYIDPRNGKPFYVGKGKGGRALSHLSDEAESKKRALIQELRASGYEPRIDILAHALPDEKTAFRIEAAVIDALSLDDLTNKVRGWQTTHYGRLPLSELTIQYAAQPVQVSVPALLIRINRLFRHTMTASELYDATRGTWKLSPRRNDAKFAFGVFRGVVREVYEIESWHPSGTTEYASRDAATLKRGRWEFIGRVADASVRDEYLGRSVVDYMQQGQRYPVAYVNC
jgi:hypothetical protein